MHQGCILDGAKGLGYSAASTQQAKRNKECWDRAMKGYGKFAFTYRFHFGWERAGETRAGKTK